MGDGEQNMFQREYLIQFSTVFVVFLLWFLSSFALRYFQYSASKPLEPSSSAEVEANQAEYIATQVWFNLANLTV
ncbi:hypothetical protein DSO57_1025697 [Entomophthora muscae]|uniref:Uncharacterized protein n=1 Tax=Entomophthora muscae TaxID=34485 RepID=A0ACC2SRI6_9FUNG|nr:hypothetical protein DSO57_1025697 [Entomophthora muscae]